MTGGREDRTDGAGTRSKEPQKEALTSQMKVQDTDRCQILTALFEIPSLTSDRPDREKQSENSTDFEVEAC